MCEQSVATAAQRVACRRPTSPRRSAADLRAKRHEHQPRPRPARASTRSSARTGAVRLDTTVYRRRRRLVGVAVAVLALGLQATLTDPGRGPAFALLFSPIFCVPVTVWCAVHLVRWSSSGSWRPASLTPATGMSNFFEEAA